jgi:hypothetical protein
MNQHHHHLARLAGAPLLAVLLFSTATPARSAIYGGRSYGLYISLPSLGIVPPVTLSDTGQLPPAGGLQTNSLLNASVSAFGGPVANATTLGTLVQGVPFTSNGSAEVQNLDLLSGHPAHLTASVVRAETNVFCTGAGGQSIIVGLTFGGVPIIVSGQPNQTISIPGVATLVINEQIQSVSSHSAAMTVNALHLTLLGADEVIVSSSTSTIDDCPGALPTVPTTWGGLKTRFAN